MEVKRRTDYAIRMMARMALNPGNPMSVSVMSAADDVPYQFARAIQRDLSQAGLIKVIRGARGGAILARPAEEISIYEIFEATQGDVRCSPCTRDNNWCPRAKGCSFHDMWHELDDMTAKFLSERTLADFC